MVAAVVEAGRHRMVSTPFPNASESAYVPIEM